MNLGGKNHCRKCIFAKICRVHLFLFVIVFCRVEGGELFDRVVNLGLLEEDLAKLLFYQMVLGVKV